MKKKKQLPPDDGRTIVEMNVDGMPWYNPTAGKKVAEEDKPTRKEKRAMIFAGFLAYLPRFLAVLLGFTIVALLLFLWLQ